MSYQSRFESYRRDQKQKGRKMDGPATARQQQVPCAISHLTSKICTVEDLISEVESKVCSIMTSRPPETSLEKEAPLAAEPDPQCPLAIDINEHATRLEVVISRLRTIVRGIEI